MYYRSFWPEIQAAIRAGESLNRLSERLGLNKSTLYYHYRKIKGRRNRRAVRHTTPQHKVGELIGAFAGDGSYARDARYHHQVCIHSASNESAYADALEKIIAEAFEIRVSRFVHGNRIRMRACSRLVLDWLREFLAWEGRRSHTIALRGNYRSCSQEFARGSLRGLLDTDGYASKSCRRVLFVTISHRLASQTRYYLRRAGFQFKARLVVPPGNRKPQYHVAVARDDAVRLVRYLRPSNPKRIREWMRPPGFELPDPPAIAGESPGSADYCEARVGA